MFNNSNMEGQFSRKSVPCFYEFESPLVVRTLKFVEKHCGISLWPCSKKDMVHRDKGPLVIMLCPVTYSSNKDATSLLDTTRDGEDVFLVLIKTVSDKGKDGDDLSRFSDPLKVQTRNRVGGSCVLFFSNTDAFKKFKPDNQNAMHEIKKVIKHISQGKKWSSALPTANDVEPQFRALTITPTSQYVAPSPTENATGNSGNIQIVNTPHVATPNFISQQALSVVTSQQEIPVTEIPHVDHGAQLTATSSGSFDDAWKVARPVASVTAPSVGFGQAWSVPRPTAAVSTNQLPSIAPPPGSHAQLPSSHVQPQNSHVTLSSSGAHPQSSHVTPPSSSVIQTNQEQEAVHAVPVQIVNFNSLETLDVFYYFPKGSNIETQTVQYVESKANVNMKPCKIQNMMVISPLLLFAPCHKRNETDANVVLNQARDGEDVFLILIEPIHKNSKNVSPVQIGDNIKEKLGALASLAYSVDGHCFCDNRENMETLGEIRTFFSNEDQEADPDGTFLTLEVRDPSDSYESYV